MPRLTPGYFLGLVGDEGGTALGTEWLSGTDAAARSAIIDDQMNYISTYGLGGCLVIGCSGRPGAAEATRLPLFQNLATLSTAFSGRYSAIKDLCIAHRGLYPDATIWAYYGMFMSDRTTTILTVAPTAAEVVDLDDSDHVTIVDAEIAALQDLGISHVIMDRANVRVINDAYIALATITGKVSTGEVSESPLGRFEELKDYFAAEGITAAAANLITGGQTGSTTMDPAFADTPQFTTTADLVSDGLSTAAVTAGFLDENEGPMFLKVSATTVSSTVMGTYLSRGFSVLAIRTAVSPTTISVNLKAALTSFNPSLLTP